jgi:hypothetical protein
MLLTHYYHRDDYPFQNLSSLTEEEALAVISTLNERDGAVYRRFKNPEQYIKLRRETEQWLSHEFVKKGGKPASTYPQYFVVERALWIEEGYEGQSNKLQMPVSAFDPKQVSFTYSDSMVSYWLREQTAQVFHNAAYHGQVFLLDEISKIINKFGIPDQEWRTQETRKYDLFIEAQVWNSSIFYR